jgi:hypothetical protein
MKLSGRSRAALDDALGSVSGGTQGVVGWHEVVMPRSCISLPVTFGTAGNFHMERILFDVTEASLPFNAILGRPTLY